MSDNTAPDLDQRIPYTVDPHTCPVLRAFVQAKDAHDSTGGALKAAKSDLERDYGEGTHVTTLDGTDRPVTIVHKPKPNLTDKDALVSNLETAAALIVDLLVACPEQARKLKRLSKLLVIPKSRKPGHNVSVTVGG